MARAGNAAWLCRRYDAEFWTTQGEYLTAHAVRTASAGYTADAVLEVFRKNGLDDERAARMRGTRNRYAELMPEFPLSYRRIIEGDEISLGKNRWRAIARYRELPDDVLVLPSHGKPFRGAHRRVEQLEQHHKDRLSELVESLKSPKSAGELLGVLFRRPLDTHQTFFAMGEAIAHLHYLYYAGRVKRALGVDGIMRYAASG